MLLMGVSAVQVSAQADTPSFAIFEHRPTPVEPEAVEPAIPAHGEMNLSLRKAAFAPSFREVIYLANVREAELRYGLPIGLLQALIWTESRFNPMAISPAGAAGLGAHARQEVQRLLHAGARRQGVEILRHQR